MSSVNSIILQRDEKEKIGLDMPKYLGTSI